MGNVQNPYYSPKYRAEGNTDLVLSGYQIGHLPSIVAAAVFNPLTLGELSQVPFVALVLYLA